MNRRCSMAVVLSWCAAAVLCGNPARAGGNDYEDLQVKDAAVMSIPENQAHLPEVDLMQGVDTNELGGPGVQADASQNEALEALPMQEQEIAPLPADEGKSGDVQAQEETLLPAVAPIEPEPEADGQAADRKPTGAGDVGAASEVIDRAGAGTNAEPSATEAPVPMEK